jgi:hypothetical protein
MISIDFRNSSFEKMYFETDVDIQKSNFSDSTFVECNFGSPHITETIFDDSEFHDVLFFDNSMILTSSFENVIYTNTNVIAMSTPQNQLWPQVETDMSMINFSQQPMTLSNSMSRGFPLTSRIYGPRESYPIHLVPRTLTEIETETQIVSHPRNRIDKPNKIFAITNVDIPVHQNAMDVIEGETQLLPHLTENTNDVAFLFQNNYYTTTRDNILRMISDSTDNDKEDNSIVFECITPNTLRMENIITKAPLVKVASLGLPTNGAYIDINELHLILNETRRYVKNRIYEIIPTEEVVKSVVSYQVLYGLTNMVGSSHCQEGQSGTMYKIRKVRNAGKIVFNAVKRAANANKTKKSKFGGRKTVRRISKTNKTKKSKFGGRTVRRK